MKRLKLRIIIETLCLTGALSLYFWASRKSSLALGVAIGALTGIVCFQLLARHILQSTSLDAQKIKPYFFLQYLIRYAIMGSVLFFCAHFKLTVFLGAACGVLLIYLVIFLDTLILKRT